MRRCKSCSTGSRNAIASGDLALAQTFAVLCRVVVATSNCWPTWDINPGDAGGASQQRDSEHPPASAASTGTSASSTPQHQSIRLGGRRLRKSRSLPTRPKRVLNRLAARPPRRLVMRVRLGRRHGPRLSASPISDIIGTIRRKSPSKIASETRTSNPAGLPPRQPLHATDGRLGPPPSAPRVRRWSCTRKIRPSSARPSKALRRKLVADPGVPWPSRSSPRWPSRC